MQIWKGDGRRVKTAFRCFLLKGGYRPDWALSKESEAVATQAYRSMYVEERAAEG